MKDARIAIFATGKGSNAEKIAQYFKDHPHIKVGLVCTNKPDSGVIEVGKSYKIPVYLFSRNDLYGSREVLNKLEKEGITHIVLAGFLWLMPPDLIQAYHHRIVNVHPALLPKFGGKGMYGMNVHQAIKEAGEKETGITIHLVNENYDEGKFLAQYITPLTGEETPFSIAEKVQLLEHQHYPEVIEKWIEG